MSGRDARSAPKLKRATALVLAYFVATWMFWVAVEFLAEHRPLAGITIAGAFGSAVADLAMSALIPCMFWGLFSLIVGRRSFPFVFWAVCVVVVSWFMLIGMNVIKL